MKRQCELYVGCSVTMVVTRDLPNMQAGWSLNHIRGQREWWDRWDPSTTGGFDRWLRCTEADIPEVVVSTVLAARARWAMLGEMGAQIIELEL